MADDTPCYVARCQTCGRLIGAAVADLMNPQVMAGAAKAKAQWVREGLNVSVMPVAQVRVADWEHVPGCVNKPKRQKALNWRDGR